jgi:hypothetical protein
MTVDLATQKVLRDYGVETKLLRSYKELQEKSSRTDGGFLFNLEGDPSVEVLLDRDYWALSSGKAKGNNDIIGYILNPKDGQSALNISIGEGGHAKSEAELRKNPGFSGFTTGEGSVAGQKVKWRRWSDRDHLYSDCKITIPSGSKEGKSSHTVAIDVTANTKERRTALENCMASLKLIKKK